MKKKKFGMFVISACVCIALLAPPASAFKVKMKKRTTFPDSVVQPTDQLFRFDDLAGRWVDDGYSDFKAAADTSQVKATTARKKAVELENRYRTFMKFCPITWPYLVVWNCGEARALQVANLIIQYQDKPYYPDINESRAAFWGGIYGVSTLPLSMVTNGVYWLAGGKKDRVDPFTAMGLNRSDALNLAITANKWTWFIAGHFPGQVATPRDFMYHEGAVPHAWTLLGLIGESPNVFFTLTEALRPAPLQYKAMMEWAESGMTLSQFQETTGVDFSKSEKRFMRAGKFNFF